MTYPQSGGAIYNRNALYHHYWFFFLLLYQFSEEPTASFMAYWRDDKKTKCELRGRTICYFKLGLE